MTDINLVERHIIKKSHVLFPYLDEYSFKAKNLYNRANYIIRQVFVITSNLEKINNGEKNVIITDEQYTFLSEINDVVGLYNEFKESKNAVSNYKPLNYFDEDHKFVNYDFLNYYLKSEDCYKDLMAQVSQQTLRLLEKNWKSFFEAIKQWSTNKDKFLGQPKLPKYFDKDGRSIFMFTNQNCKLKDNFVIFPKVFNKFKIKTKVNNLRQIRVIPNYNHYVIEVVHKESQIDLLGDNDRYIGIDLGVNNLAAITNNFGAIPIILNGKSIKSMNQYYNKEMAHYRSVTKQMNKLDYSNKMAKLTFKRNNKIDYALHCASKYIVEYALKYNCHTIVIGNNKNLKQESNIGKINNQNFIQIPHQKLIKEIEYKASKYGINVIIVEESYTSGTSFIDGEEPIKENYNIKRRIKRGLFVSDANKTINADVNGSYQIIKKAFPNAFCNGIEGVGLHPIMVNC